MTQSEKQTARQNALITVFTGISADDISIIVKLSISEEILFSRRFPRLVFIRLGEIHNNKEIDVENANEKTDPEGNELLFYSVIRKSF